MSDWLSDVIDNDLIAVYESLEATEDALMWLREKSRTFGELRAEEIDWLRWMACNPMTPKPVLGKLAEDPVVFVRRGVAQNSSTPVHLLLRLNDDAESWSECWPPENAATPHLYFPGDGADPDPLVASSPIFAPLVFSLATSTGNFLERL
jgi:hypothetical protein